MDSFACHQLHGFETAVAMTAEVVKKQIVPATESVINVSEQFHMENVV